MGVCVGVRIGIPAVSWIPCGISVGVLLVHTRIYVEAHWDLGFLLLVSIGVCIGAHIGVSVGLSLGSRWVQTNWDSRWVGFMLGPIMGWTLDGHWMDIGVCCGVCVGIEAWASIGVCASVPVGISMGSHWRLMSGLYWGHVGVLGDFCSLWGSVGLRVSCHWDSCWLGSCWGSQWGS